MLSAIGRASIRRVVAIRPKSTNHLHALLERAEGSQSVHQYAYQFLASFSSSVFRQNPASATEEATKKPAAKKTVAKKASERPAKPKAKKATPRRAAKPKAKKKVVAKKKPVKKKPIKKKPIKKKPVKKVLTPEQKKKQQIKLLKQLALSPPKGLPSQPLNLYAGALPARPAGVSQAEHFAAHMKRFKNISPSELEALNHTANQNRSANAAEYAAWLRSYSPEQIKIANNARNQLRKKDDSKRRWFKIEDPRQPTRGASSFTIFVRSRWASGDFKGISALDAIRIISSDYAKLSADEKKALKSQAADDQNRFKLEAKTVYGH